MSDDPYRGQGGGDDQGGQPPTAESGPPPGGEDPWGGRVAFSTDQAGLPYAYRPGQVLTTRVDEALEVLGRRGEDQIRPDGVSGPFTRLSGVRDVLGAVHELRVLGIVAQPNHVYFAHSAGCCPPHPAAPCGCGESASPVYASPVYASPVYASPVYASPVYASPVYASPVYASGAGTVRHNSATPAQVGPTTNQLKHQIDQPVSDDAPEIYVLDTGLAASEPAFAPAAITASAGISAATPTDFADPDPNGNGYLDPAAGHSTFISGLIESVAPGSQVIVHQVLSGDGDGDELTIAQVIDGLNPQVPHRAILNLSFGGYVLDQPFVLAQAINGFLAKGSAVVASAGNDASCRSTYPAALPGVIGVGALGPSGPAPFTNYGPWVAACAPGVDLISAFFRGWTDSSGTYAGWAIWSGTSFSAPLVGASLARLLLARPGGPVRRAIEELIESPWLMQITNLGTIVNTV